MDCCLLEILKGLRIELSRKSWRPQHIFICLNTKSVAQPPQECQSLPLHDGPGNVSVVALSLQASKYLLLSPAGLLHALCLQEFSRHLKGHPVTHLASSVQLPSAALQSFERAEKTPLRSQTS